MADHLIGIRPAQGRAGNEFYDRRNGLPFLPRGNNYIRVDPVTQNHNTFNPDRYNPPAIEAALEGMRSVGYNVVRVFVSPDAVGNPDGPGLLLAYLTNVADFLRRALAQGILTILTFPYLPKQGGYRMPNDPEIQGYNLFYLEATQVAEKGRYLQDFIGGLQRLNAPLEAIFSYHIENEIFFRGDQEPLTLPSGAVRAANGRTYDMGVPAAKQRMMDESLVYWIDQVCAAVRQVDSSALLAPGFFSPRVGLSAVPRVIRTLPAIADPAVGGSSADYIDLHVYLAHTQFNMGEILAAFEIDPHTTRKPLLLGEFGAARPLFQNNIRQAAPALVQLQVATCAQYGFSGWLFWTWDTQEQTTFFNALESNGAINGELAPVARPNPCLPQSLPRARGGG